MPPCPIAVPTVLPALLAMMLATAPCARAAEIVGSRVFVETAFPATTAEMKAAERWGAEHFDKGLAAGRPVTVRVARSGRTTLISLESVAVCDRVRACPLLVFRDLTKPPVHIGWAFQNLVLDYREKDTWLILRSWDTVTECRLSGTTRATCRPVTASGPTTPR